MSESLSPSALRVQQELRARGFPYQVQELDQPTRTAADAARAVGCELGQIAKSLVFARESTGKPVLVITSGANRVDEAALAARLGETSIRKPDGDFVREQTGFVIGGVAPLAHSQPVETYIDEDLLRYPEIWAAAGTPHALFRLDPADLPRMTGGAVIPVQ